MHFFSSTFSWDKKCVLLSLIVRFTVLYLNTRNCTLFCPSSKYYPYAGYATAAMSYSDAGIWVSCSSIADVSCRVTVLI